MAIAYLLRRLVKGNAVAGDIAIYASKEEADKEHYRLTAQAILLAECYRLYKEDVARWRKESSTAPAETWCEALRLAAEGFRKDRGLIDLRLGIALSEIPFLSYEICVLPFFA